MTDYSTARYFAISGIGYGKGFTAEEARDNYVATQLRNYPASSTIFKTKAKWKTALTNGEAAARVWRAPKGTTGFYSDGAIHWTDRDGYTIGDATEEQLVTLD